MLTNLTDRAIRTIRQHDLLHPCERVVVAVSGGPDSMALLGVLIELRQSLALSLHVAHLNHGLRGAAADADAAFVADQARSLGLRVTVERAELGRGSVEHAARSARYAFLERVAAAEGAVAVAVGHTADDQVETVLEGLLRGGGLSALRGMPVCRPLGPAARVVRPLLDAVRVEVMGYLTGSGMPWREDASNAELVFERNFVRHVLLPRLEERMPALRGQLLGMVPLADELSTVVERLGRARLHCADAEARLDADGLAASPRLVGRAAVHAAYEAAGGAGDLRRRAVDAVETLSRAASGRQVALADGIVASREYESIVLARRKQEPGRVNLPLPIPGRAEAPEAGLWVEAAPVDGPAESSPWTETVDRECVGESLTVRTRRDGDRFEPLGLGGRKKLKDFLIDERAPRPERTRQLVVTGDRGIVWVVGRRLDDRARITSATRRFVRLRAGRLE